MSREERMYILGELTGRLDRIIELLEVKNKSCEPELQFIKPNNVENTFIEDRQREIFNSLDRKEVE